MSPIRKFTWTALGAAFVAAACTSSPPAPPSRTASSPASVLEWNAVAQRVTISVAKQYQAQSMIHIALAQAAVYDAVVAIIGGYRPYALRVERQPGASVDAAVASAAHGVLAHYFPDQRQALDADLTRSLAAVPDGAAKEAGRAIGRAAADSVLALRRGDGMDADIGFKIPPTSVGAWQPPAGATPQTPWVSRLKPFMLQSPDQFRPVAPPDLASRTWADDFLEVKRLGGATAAARNEEQTETATFWSTNSVAQFNGAFRQMVADRKLDAMSAARLFAMGNMVGADALIACFDAKYHYVFWRPQDAIPRGSIELQSSTGGDSAWKPLLPTPNHPEYPAAHGCLTAAEATTLAAFVGSKRIDVTLISNLPKLTRPARTYVHADELVGEMSDARVWGGLHYRRSVDVGVEVGRKVATWALERYFQAAQ
jgi:PAP2 superfamily